MAIIDTYISKVERDVREQYMRLLEDALAPYGISKENVFSEGRRVRILQEFDYRDPFVTTDTYYIDGKYAFSIVKSRRYDKNCIFVDVKLVKGDTDV